MKASERNTTSGCSAWIVPMSQCQKGSGLVWGLSTRKVRTPWAIQKRRTSSSARHSPSRSAVSKFSGTMSSYFFGGFSA